MDSLFSIINIEALQTRAIAHLPSITAAVGILIAGHFVYKLVHRPAEKALQKAHVEDALIKIISKIIRIVLIIIALIMAASQLGVDVGAALAGIGVVGIAVGFAAQDSLSNIIAGFIIFTDKPFRVGDFITHEDNYGRVEQITLRSTRIRTQNNTYVVIPNQKIINEVVVDHSTNGDTRIVVKVSIAYKESVDKAREVLVKAINQIEGVLESPHADVVVDELADSGVNLLVRVWIGDASSERATYFKLTEVCKSTLDEAGISIPFPHMRVIMDKDSK